MADIDNVQVLLAKDIYYHKQCLQKFMAKYKRKVTTCLLCSKSVNTKFHLISVEDAQGLLNVSRDNQDLELFVKITSKYDETRRCILSFMYAHSNCKVNYLSSNESSKLELYERLLTPLIEDLILKEYGITVSELRNYCSEEVPGVQFQNKHIKSFLVRRFNEQISFCAPYRKNESEVIYPSSIDPALMIQKLQVLNELKTAGRILRSKLREMSFNLDDSFCDSVDLQNSMNQTRMPESVIEFLGALLNINKRDFVQYQKKMTNGVSFESDDDDDDDADDDANDVHNSIHQPINKCTKVPKKMLKANSLFQCMFYMANNGRKKVPMHVMLAHAIYDKSKSRELITSCNNLGFCVSYPELLKLRALFGFYIICRYISEDIPLPSHFNKSQFTLVSIDNFDHHDASSLTGKHDTHDSAMVLFQSVPFRAHQVSLSSKGKVSEYTDFRVAGRRYISKLPCQMLRPFSYWNKAQALPDDFISEKFEYEPNDKPEELLQLARNINLQQDSHKDNNAPSWAGCHSIISTANDIPIMKVGFLPIIPHPITDIQTVYTCLKNCDSIASQLQQKTLPVVCDEGVYHLVTKIYLQEPGICSRLLPMLGGFHFAKTALHCAGKFVKGSGVEDIFIESGVFGPKTADSVLNGKHYYRSLDGLTMLSDSISRLKMHAFWNKHSNNYTVAIKKLDQFKHALNNHDRSYSISLLSDLSDCEFVQKLMKDIDTFTAECSQKSMQCKFLLNFVSIMDLIHNFIRSEREGIFCCI